MGKRSGELSATNNHSCGHLLLAHLQIQELGGRRSAVYIFTVATLSVIYHLFKTCGLTRFEGVGSKRCCMQQEGMH